jgi:hypothetical protein
MDIINIDNNGDDKVHVQIAKEAAQKPKIPESTIKQALDEISAGSSIYAASKKFSVPRTTLFDRKKYVTLSSGWYKKFMQRNPAISSRTPQLGTSGTSTSALSAN